MSTSINRQFLPTIFISILLILLTSCNSAPETPSSRPAASIPLENCELSAPGLSLQVSGKCGKLPVYENRAAGTGRMIDLNIAVIPAASPSPAPDPLFFLAGGPGQAATEAYPQLSIAFNGIHQNRDIVLVDQRGTGKSNPLLCPKPDSNATEATANDTLTEWAQDCLNKLDANPEFYTTTIAMQDLDQVRTALGYDKINLYGVSYGTRAALTYLRLFPDYVRSAILDGVVPQTEKLGLNVARNAQNALDLIFKRCTNDSGCYANFPEISKDFKDLMETIDAQPMKVNVANPVSGEIMEIGFNKDELANTIRLLSYTTETVALLPLQIHTTQTTKDYSLLAAQYLIVSDQLTAGIANGLNYSILCSEDVPFYTPEEAAKANEGTYMGNLQTDQLFEICKVWPRAEIPADFKEPVRSKAPVLLLSGAYDPVTPPSNAEITAETLPNSLSLVAPGQGHNVIYRGCLPYIASDFLELGSVEGLDTGCLQGLEPMPFFVNFSGPMP